MNPSALVEARDSVLLVIDVQGAFVERLPVRRGAHDRAASRLAGRRRRLARRPGGRDGGGHAAIVAGFETDVCVAQPAIGLVGLGYRVVAVADCGGSPGSAHQAGLDRMAAGGVLVLSWRSLLYEWLRTVETSRRLRAEYVARWPLPPGLVL